LVRGYPERRLVARLFILIIAAALAALGGPGLAAAGMHGSMTAFELPFRGPAKATALRQAIWKHRTELPVIERPDRLMIRVSTHFYNTFAEIDRLADVLPAALRSVCG